LSSTIFTFVFKVADWPSKNVGNFNLDGKTGKVIHYAQMAWGKSIRIGCGYISFMDKTKPATPFRRVCCLSLFLFESFLKMYFL
jgi:hypothetical protein